MSMQPREKCLTLGVESLSDAELLAIFLRTGLKGKPVIALAQELLDTHKGLNGLLNLPGSDLSDIPGLGEAKIATLQAGLELGKRYLYEKIQCQPRILSSREAREYIHLKLKSREQEVFACLFLNNQQQVIKYEELFYGTLDHVVVHPREVAKRALDNNAAAVIIAHNHPGGSPKPSTNDQILTKRIRIALEMLEIELADHIIVAGNTTYSFSEHWPPS
ncbi:MAG: RadC family protein [Gammaproteobacteria bacterium]